MKAYEEYRFSGAEATVKVVDVYWKNWSRYVDFYDIYNGRMVGDIHTIRYSYAKKNWKPA
ncbi:hypothetical protein SEA_BEUFFERT_209 [Streptomyces phage Beuffert]|nr:hypothetical protein SEA_BEUFFERT_209 [Streptomyces phage Beuffert]